MKKIVHPFKVLLLTSLGGILEFYDFIIYALLASYLSQHFFPTQNPVLSLMAAFATYAVGYLARPIGGVVLGHFGDTRSRQQPFSFSILIMALSTLAIGLLPTYETAGIVAPLLLTLLRIVQGFSVGGEIPGAVTYIYEVLSDRRGLACGIVFAGITLGVVLGSFTIGLLSSLLSAAQMHLYGWRIPFIMGGIFGFVSFLARRTLKQAEQYQPLKNQYPQFPIRLVLQMYPKATGFGTALMMLAITDATLFFIYLPAYMNRVLNHPVHDFMYYYALALSFSAIGCIISGYLSDKVSCRHLLMLLAIFSMILALPIYSIYVYYPVWTPYALMISIIPSAMSYGIIPRVLADLFPEEVRYTGVGLCYNLGSAIFGSVTPFLATLLIYRTHDYRSPSYLIIFVATVVLGIITSWRHQQNAH